MFYYFYIDIHYVYESSFLFIDDEAPYFSLEHYGIGRNLLSSLVEGFIFFAIVFIIEYQICARLVHRLYNICFPLIPEEVQNEDSDVIKEKDAIRNTDESVLKAKYVLALKDMTKCHKKKLTVNGLSLGVNSYECFGLLGN